MRGTQRRRWSAAGCNAAQHVARCGTTCYTIREYYAAMFYNPSQRSKMPQGRAACCDRHATLHCSATLALQCNSWTVAPDVAACTARGSAARTTQTCRSAARCAAAPTRCAALQRSGFRSGDFGGRRLPLEQVGISEGLAPFGDRVTVRTCVRYASTGPGQGYMLHVTTCVVVSNQGAHFCEERRHACVVTRTAACGCTTRASRPCPGTRC
jgi:hypothetical protein